MTGNHKIGMLLVSRFFQQSIPQLAPGFFPAQMLLCGQCSDVCLTHFAGDLQMFAKAQRPAGVFFGFRPAGRG